MGAPPQGFCSAEKGENFDDAKLSATPGRHVRRVFYHHSGRLDYVWFSHGAALPAILYDLVLRPWHGLSYTVHRGNEAIHIRRAGGLVGLVWPCGIFAPEVAENARPQLSALGRDLVWATEKASKGSSSL